MHSWCFSIHATFQVRTLTVIQGPRVLHGELRHVPQTHSWCTHHFPLKRWPPEQPDSSSVNSSPLSARTPELVRNLALPTRNLCWLLTAWMTPKDTLGPRCPPDLGCLSLLGRLLSPYTKLPQRSPHTLCFQSFLPTSLPGKLLPTLGNPSPTVLPGEGLHCLARLSQLLCPLSPLRIFPELLL